MAILVDWCLLDVARARGRITTHLAGAVFAHPLLPEMHQIITSPLRELALDGAWARTLSRCYRLELPLDANRRESFFRTVAPTIAAVYGIQIRDIRVSTGALVRKTCRPIPEVLK